MAPIIAAAISDVTKSVKSIGTRDWLLIALTLFLMFIAYGAQRATNLSIAALAAQMQPMAEGIKKQGAALDKTVLFQFGTCMKDAKDDQQAIRRCEQMMNGIRPWQ